MDTVREPPIGAEHRSRTQEDFRRQYQELVNECRDGIYQRSRDGRFLFVNPSFCKMLGYEQSALLRMKLDDIRDHDDPRIGPIIEKMLNSNELPGLLTSRFKHRDGHWVPVETSARCLDDGRIQVTVRDITDRLRTEAALARQRDLYAALSETNKAIIEAQSREALFEQACRIAVQYGKLRFAAINLIDPADRRLRPVARHGEDYGYLNSVTIDTDPSRPEGRGAAGKAVRSGKRQVSNDFLNDPCNAPWHRGAARAGIGASAAFPLRQGNQVVGTLNLYAAEAGFFTDELLPTLDDMAAGLSHALDGFAREADRRQAETALRISEERLRTLVQATSQIIWITDAHGVTVETSATFEELTGLEKGDPREGIWLQALHPDDRESAIASWDYAFSNGVAYDLESRVHMRDGSYRWFAVHGQPILEADGSIREWIGTCTDINVRKLADQTLRDSQRHYLELVEEARDGIYQRDTDGRFLFVNKALCEMLGYGRDELLQLSIQQILDLDDPRVAHCVDDPNGTAEPTGLLDLRFKHRDGHWVPVEIAKKGLGSGRIQVMVRDISARQQAQQREREYLNKTQELSRRLLTVQEQERSGIARELHDEIGSALTALQMTLKHIEDDMPAGMKDLPRDSQRIVATLLKQVRTMSLDLRPSILDDLGLAAALRWYARDRLQPAGLQIELDVSPDIGRLPSEIESACFRVLQGAATNALRHGHAHRLELSLSRTGETLELTVRDDGDGFDVEAARKLAHNGASLGMLAMEERMRLIGGELHFDSTLGHGTAVQAIVPLHEPAQ